MLDLLKDVMRNVDVRPVKENFFELEDPVGEGPLKTLACQSIRVGLFGKKRLFRSALNIFKGRLILIALDLLSVNSALFLTVGLQWGWKLSWR